MRNPAVLFAKFPNVNCLSFLFSSVEAVLAVLVDNWDALAVTVM